MKNHRRLAFSLPGAMITAEFLDGLRDLRQQQDASFHKLECLRADHKEWQAGISALEICRWMLTAQTE